MALGGGGFTCTSPHTSMIFELVDSSNLVAIGPGNVGVLCFAAVFLFHTTGIFNHSSNFF